MNPRPHLSKIRPTGQRRRFPYSVLVTLIVVLTATWGVSCTGVLSQDQQRSLEEKASKVEATAPAWLQAGGDMGRFRALADRLDGHLSSGEMNEADEVLDEILALLATTDEDDTAADVAAAPEGDDLEQVVTNKARQVEERIPVWIGAGGDVERFQALRGDLERHLGNRDLQSANDVLDDILALIGEPAATVGASAAGSAAARDLSTRPIPETAEIAFHMNERIYVMDASGGDVTEIVNTGRHLEHVTVSPDRRKVAANYWARPEVEGVSSRIVIYDLEADAETALVPEFQMAGNGGVDWGSDGYIYFAGLEEEPYAQPRNGRELRANFGANDIYKVRPDGTGLVRLTDDPDRGFSDVSISEDDTLITYNANNLATDGVTEIWVNDTAGDNPRLVYVGGEVRVSSVHDPELSSDNTRVIFSKVNPNFRNFRSTADTAHDLYIVNLDGTGLERVTEPGPISIIPDWVNDRILYLELTDQGGREYNGISFVRQDGSGQTRLLRNGNSPKWLRPLAR